MSKGTAVTTMRDVLPHDLALVTGKGLTAIEAFLDLPSDSPDAAFHRSLSSARIGTSVTSTAVRYLAVLNNRAMIELRQQSFEARKS